MLFFSDNTLPCRACLGIGSCKVIAFKLNCHAFAPDDCPGAIAARQALYHHTTVDKQLAAIKTTRSKLSLTSRGLATFFLIIVLYCAAHVAVFLYMALLPNGFSLSRPSTLGGHLAFHHSFYIRLFLPFSCRAHFSVKFSGRNASSRLTVCLTNQSVRFLLATAICGFISPRHRCYAKQWDAHMLIESDVCERSDSR